jgi:hypothetical protein
LKFGWDVAWAFLREAASAVLPPDQAYGGDDSDSEFGGSFCHFNVFSSLTALMI